MKRVLQVFALFLALFLVFAPLRVLAAIDLDGRVSNAEWYDHPITELFRSDAASLCSITQATLRHEIQTAQSRVVFAFTALAPSVSDSSPIGAAFFVNGQEIGRWQLGAGTSNLSADYDLRGYAYIPADSANSGYSFEIALGYKTESGLAALQTLSVLLFDPQGVSSKAAAYPILPAVAPTTTTTTTTAKTTTTKAPATEKSTTTKATAAKTTTAKTTAATKSSAAVPVYTTAPPAAQPERTTQPTYAAAPDARTAAGTSKTSVIWYTQVYTNPATGSSGTAPQTLWTYAAEPTEASQEEALPTLAMAESQASQPVPRQRTLLFAAGGILILLAAVLVIFWLRAQKASKAAENDQA